MGHLFAGLLVLLISLLSISTADITAETRVIEFDGFESKLNGLNNVKRETAIGREAMVSSTHYLATEAAIEVLKNGGNAADASAVIQFVLSVVQPQSTGIGGGCVILHYDGQNKTAVALDGREEAPNLFHEKQFCVNNDCLTNPNCDCSSGVLPTTNRQTGGHPVGVPGTVKTVAKYLREFGTISLNEAVQPAINLARYGFPMYQKLYDEIVNNAARLRLFPESARLYLNPNDLTKPICEVGETFYNPDIANTLEELGLKGEELFYTGDVAHDIFITVQSTANPNTGKYGLISLDDLANYRPVYRDPLKISYRGHEVYGFPPPISGGVAILQMLNFLEAFDTYKEGILSIESLHRMIDAQNIAFADRNKYLGDADFVDVPIEGLLDKNYMRKRRNELAEPFAAIQTPIQAGYPPGSENSDFPQTHDDHEVGTTHWSVVDRFGNAVAFTSTIEANMGAAVVVPGRGFLLNNELTDFEAYGFDDQGNKYANAPEGGKKLRRTALGTDSQTYGGKRPRSSMAPTLIFNTTNGEMTPYFITGSPGGSSIPGAVFNVIVNAVIYGKDLQLATDIARVLGKNTEISAEYDIYFLEEGGVMAGLVSRGFNFTTAAPTTATYGRVQSILIGKDGYLYGAADLLREPQALAAGY